MKFTTPDPDIKERMVNRWFQTRQMVYVKEDIMINRPGQGTQLFVAAGTLVQIMSYDPSQEKPYGIRPASEPYRNVMVAENQLTADPKVAVLQGL